MSYPRQLQTLIIEDDPRSKELYESLFIDIRNKDSSILRPRYAFSYEDAIIELNQKRIFHLVILDLCLPERIGRPASVGVDHGMRLLEACERRESYPIIALLVITGNADRTEQTDLRNRLQRLFSYGQLIIKGGNSLLSEFESAFKSIRAYIDIGLHIQDTGPERWPVLAPRDEDLLRRAALANAASGYDLRWWSAEYSKPTGQHAAFRGWTKVLMGHFLLADGRGASRPVFCKLMPKMGFEVTVNDVQVLEQKLSHIKIRGVAVGGDRSLLITEKTGDGSTPPVTLNVFLSRPATEVSASISTITSDIIHQTEMLGDSRSDLMRTKDLLWQYHSNERLDTLCKGYSPDRVSEEFLTLIRHPVELLRRVQQDQHQLRVELRDCLHGDLNITNVAIDLEREPRGYIFDASGVGSGPAMRDLAMLEVSALLHLPADAERSIVIVCARYLYGSSFMPALPRDGTISDHAFNILTLINSIREHARARWGEFLYALCVFDQVLIQVGGLEWLAGNKIRSPREAVRLAFLISGWFARIYQSEISE